MLNDHCFGVLMPFHNERYYKGACADSREPTHGSLHQQQRSPHTNHFTATCFNIRSI